MGRHVLAVVIGAASGVLMLSGAATAADSASIVAGTLVQGSVKASLGAGTAYASETANLGDWVLNTGEFGGTTLPISVDNGNFNGNSFGGTENTMVAFGNGGGVTLQFSTPITPAAGRKDLGIFTGQMLLDGSGSVFNGNMEAAILVSADGVSWYTLAGALVNSPTTYTATSYSLNAPAVAYNYKTGATAASYGNGASDAELAALTIADYTTPMPDDSIFNSPTSTDAQRASLMDDSSMAGYAAVFGTSGGGNWFDISGAGLSQVEYVRLNGVNVPSSGGIRLDAVFANAAAVPEPASLGMLAMGGLLLLKRRR